MGATGTQTLFHDWGPCQEPTGKVRDFQPLPLANDLRNYVFCDVCENKQPTPTPLLPGDWSDHAELSLFCDGGVCLESTGEKVKMSFDDCCVILYIMIS